MGRQEYNASFDAQVLKVAHETCGTRMKLHKVYCMGWVILEKRSNERNLVNVQCSGTWQLRKVFDFYIRDI